MELLFFWRVSKPARIEWLPFDTENVVDKLE